MHLLLLLLTTCTLTFASNATFSLFNRQTIICQILPITPGEFGNAACGDGSVDTSAGCICCPDGVTPCDGSLQTCQAGSGVVDICVDNNAGGSDCASQGLQACGNSCMPVGQTCCASAAAYCPASDQCCTLSDGSNGCCPLNSNTAGSATSTVGSSSSAQTTTSYSVQSTTAAPIPGSTSFEPITTSFEPITASTSITTSFGSSTSVATTTDPSNASPSPNSSSKLSLLGALKGLTIVVAWELGLF